MLYGAMNFPIKPVYEEMEKIAGLGFDYLELAMDPPCAHYADINRQKKALRRGLDQHGLKLVCHLPCFVYTADLTPSLRKASLEEMLASLETAASLGAMKVVLHPSFINGMGGFAQGTAHGYAMESLQSIVEQAGALGVCLCFENMFPQYMSFFEPKAFEAVFEQFPALKMTLDTGHANIGDPGGNRLFEFMEAFADKINHIHVSDNFGKKDDHLAVGKAGIDFARFTRAVRAMNYDGTVTFEIFSQDPQDLVRSRQAFSDLMRKASSKGSGIGNR